jgi:hypothetical protein
MNKARTVDGGDDAGFLLGRTEAREKEHEWWSFVAEKVEDQGQAGFNALWLPLVNKGSSNTSMGYDPYGYFYLGDFDQKGGTKTFYGNKAELEALIAKAHKNGIGLYADMVISHNSGADEEEVDLPPFLTQTDKTQNPLNGELSHGIVTQAVHQGVQAGRRSAAGIGGLAGRGGARLGSQPQRFASLAA